jgi:dihydroxyacid dehydratase/phosphogluconate dehydratase
METEELLRSYPIDGAVLMGGCDKTTPGLLMGAESMDLPALFMPAGPARRGDHSAGLAGDRERDRPLARALPPDGRQHGRPTTRTPV